MPRQALHAETLSFHQPISREPLSFTAPLPEDMESALQKIRSAVTLALL